MKISNYELTYAYINAIVKGAILHKGGEKMSKMYSLRNAADILGIKVRTAREWVHSGKMNASKYPNSQRWYVTEEEINRIRGENDDNND